MSAFIESNLETVCLEYLNALGWSTSDGGSIAPNVGRSERSTYAHVVLEERLHEAVRRLNPHLPEEIAADVVRIVGRAESQAAITENWRVYRLLTEGVPVEYRNASGDTVHDRAWLIDWGSPETNDFLAVRQFTVVEGGKMRRPDIIGFVNGLPFVLIELKATGSQGATLRSAHNQVRTYVNDVPALFASNAVCIVSDGLQARLGTMSGAWEHFAPWKAINSADLASPSIPELEVLLRGALDKHRLLDLIRNFTVFSDEGSGLVKRVAKYHQFWAVNAAVRSTVQASTTGDGRAGVVWHTQGSGKSLEMLFFASKIMRAPEMANPTVVVLTDRNDLDDQLFGEVFAAARNLPDTPEQAETRDHLRRLLVRNSGGIVFTTLQKFGLSQDDRNAGRAFPALSTRRNIVVVADEAHRSQYEFIDGLAKNLRDALPNAAFIGFTGTPIEEADRNTRQVFGDYIDKYDLTQAVADGATVKVLYEARLARIDVPSGLDDALDNSFDRVTEGYESDVKQHLKSRWGRVEAIVGSEQRLTELAADIVEHWEARRNALEGKALIAAMSRRIAANLYEAIVALRPEWHSPMDDEGILKVVITGSAADDQELQPHIRDQKRLRLLKQRAKDPSDPLELVIVVDMWLTGFDSPSMHTMYVDKPMRGAALMQAIARVNRTFRDKPAGLIVDYIGIADDLQAALADYTDRDKAEGDVGRSVEAEALPHLIEKHEVVAYGILHGHDWRAKAFSGVDKAYLEAMAECVDFILAEPERRERFLEQTRMLIALFVMCVPNPVALTLRDDVAFFQRIVGFLSKADAAESLTGEGNGAELNTAIKQVVSQAISGGGVIDIYGQAGLPRPDLSLIDEDFINQMKSSPQPNLQIELLRRLLNDGIRAVSKTNVVMEKKFSEMLSASLLAYNNRSIDAAQVIAELADLAGHLKAEESRGARLKMSVAELAFYDAVRTNEAAFDLVDDDVLQVIARDLVRAVRKNATIDWSSKESVRAKLRAAVRRVLLNHDYPPDRQAKAVDLVLEQAQVVATEWLTP